MSIPHFQKVDGTLELESDPVGPYDAVTKRYLDAASGDHISSPIGTGAGPTVSVRMGVRAAFVTWSGVGDNVSGHGYYQVQMATDSGFTTIVDDVASKTNWAVFDGLVTGTSYWWRVRGVDAAGNTSDWTTTAPSDAPDTVIEDDIEDLNVTVDKEASPVMLETDHEQKIGSLSITDTNKAMITGTLAVPSWAGDAFVTAVGTIAGYNESASSKFLYVSMDIGGFLSGDSFTEIPATTYGQATSVHAQQVTMPGTTISWTLRSRHSDTGVTWNDSVQTAQCYAQATFVR